MNSVEAYKGFITFIILGVIVALSVFGFGLVNKSSNNSSEAKDSYSDPRNIKVDIKNVNSVIISWETELETESKLIYSKFADLNKPQTASNGNSKTRNHSILIENLDANTLYFYSIVQSGKRYPEIGSLYTFTTSTAETVAPVIRESNENQIELHQQPSEQAESVEPQTTQPSTNTRVSEEFTGFGDAKEAKPGQSLGAKTNIIGENIAKEFKEAVLYQDLRYDFNSDGEVDPSDYPLFINFILNQED